MRILDVVGMNLQKGNTWSDSGIDSGHSTVFLVEKQYTARVKVSMLCYECLPARAYTKQTSYAIVPRIRRVRK